MSRGEFLSCVERVAAAFTGAANTLAVVKERKERKKRKKDKDVEELVEIRLLHKSLMEGANQSQLCSEERHHRHGPAFDAGDHIATSQLKDVLIALQTDVIQALQLAKAVDNAILDLSHLHEASITSRKDAIQAMDDLCRRITSAGIRQSRFGDDYYGQLGSRDSTRPHYAYSRMEGSIPGYSDIYQPGSMRSYSTGMMMSRLSPDPHEDFHRAQSVRQPGLIVPIAGRYPSRHTPSYSWFGSSMSRSDMIFARHANISKVNENETRDARAYSDIDQMNELSLRDSGIGTDVGSRTVPTRPSVDSIVTSSPRQASITSDRSSQGRPVEIRRESSNRSDVHRKPVLQNDENGMSPDSPDAESVRQSSRATSTSSPGSASASGTSRTIESADEMTRAMAAPEVVTKDNQPMLSLHNSRPSPNRPSHLAAVHPALRVPHSYIDVPASPEPDSIWLPLPRPARHNSYHGFCKGAWQIRKSVQEGISIQMIPDEQGVNVPHWSCKLCQFKCKSLNQNPLPDQIYFSTQSGIRYRWLFLAKSHTPAVGSFHKPENYSYGCIFCAAEGRASPNFEKLDKLMVHIQKNHRTVMMTPETKTKTKCIVGGAPDKAEEWDINLPETKPRFVAGGAVGEFMVSAMTGLSRYGSSNAL